ncbi:Branched-chain amino acid transport ATP-binding protein LivF (TC 3.A.1.4.1) [Actinomycetales bacterium JB111]|nr:Branched-chain amino acid transport ATP-binding protein LivF (TC 3.A.1.4.1) [Actinomycetales bacterium JB111]
MELNIRDLKAGYGRVSVLDGINLDVHEGEYVAVVGANGAGKTTLLKAISGTVTPSGGQILADGTNIAGLAAHRVPKTGIAHVPEGRQVFPGLTVAENLDVGAYLQRDKDRREESRQEIFALFPRLGERLNQLAGTMSGGEQQMLALARALMLRPRLLMLDEPSQGLAPKVVTEMYEALDRIREAGMTVLLVEQNVATALRHADRAYVLEHGEIAMSGPASELADNDEIRRAYLGV